MTNESENNDSSRFLKTDGGKTKSNAIEMPSISLPKGGGAIKGIDEKFRVNAINGTASFSVPLPFSTSRGVSPALSLSYNSGAGNGIFGLGWNINLPSIKRKTDKELPKYQDKNESDTYLFSDAEDLVPEFKKENDGSLSKDAAGGYIIKEKKYPDELNPLFTIRYYKPRIEGIFARIERWTEESTGLIKWRIMNRENVTTLFGWNESSRIFHPDDPKKIFEWLPEFVFDDKGNCSYYSYKREDDKGFDPALLHNKNRLANGKITYTNIYPERILYGNKTPYKKFGDPFPSETDYLFETVFDYGEYDQNNPYNKTREWDFRGDAFSNYKPGFEIRTTRLCKSVFLFHHFKGSNEYDGLVRSLDFSYDIASQTGITFLKSVTSKGYIKKTDGTYSVKNLPPVEFEYQKHEWNKQVKYLDSENLVHAPSGFDDQQYLFTDLFNEGLSGILTEQANGWYYKHNLGNGDFEQAKLVSPRPSFTGLGRQVQLLDLNGDGRKQLVNYHTDPRGYFELGEDDQWTEFRSFITMPGINLQDPATRMIDLNGDGKADILISEDNVLTIYESRGKEGFSEAERIHLPFEEEEGPKVVFADRNQSVFLAEMNGDGMTDILRVRNGEVCYWPNKGYGKFGSKVGMDNAPVFDHPDSFNPAYLRLADIDGSGTTDIMYLGKNKFSCWMNLSGNALSNIPVEIAVFPEIQNQTNIMVTDLLGNGTACIVWTSPLSKDSGRHFKYIDLMDSKKPHIMVAYKNNLGKEVTLEYTPSTKFYINDKLAGNPWITKLHFPVHCVSKTVTLDRITGYRFTTVYTYHHGYYDHDEQEFRGFGLVQQTDTETFEHWKKGNAANILEETLHQEPVVTRAWYQTGAFTRSDTILNRLAEGFWYGEMKKQGFSGSNHEKSLPEARLVVAPGIDPSMIDRLSALEWKEAFRACKGMALRMETFARDAVKYGNTTEARQKELTPYSVSTHNCIIELIQPKGKNKHAVFIVKESEAISYGYERNTDDPRIAHTLNIKLDEYSNVLESASVVYPRLSADNTLPAETRQEQNRTVIIYTQNQFTNDVLSDEAYRLRLPSEVKTFELKGVSKTGAYYSPLDFTDILAGSKSDTALYHETEKPLIAGKSQKRLIEHVRSKYYRNDLSGPLPLHRLESMALSFESYQLAYTPELIADIFGSKVNTTTLNEGKFTNSEGDNNYWIRSGTKQFISAGENVTHAKNRFFVPVSYTDPYGAVTKVKYYGTYFLFIEEKEDALGNRSGVASFNFRTLSPRKIKDLNGNFSETVSDELGLIKAVALTGKGNEADELTGISETTDVAENTMIINFFQASDSVQLTATAKSLLNRSTTRFVYDLNAWMSSGKPAVVAGITRVEHYRQNAGSAVQIGFEYSNGAGEVIMKKVQAKPGPAKQVTINAGNTVTVSDINTSALVPKQLRWIGNGRTVKNNKGNPVKEYEPYFSVSHRYEDHKELVETGVTPVMYYDAHGRLIKKEMPDGTFSKVEFDSWKQIVYDANDTVSLSPWYSSRTNRAIDALLVSEGKDPVKEKQAADKAAIHAGTPNVLHFDTLGRPVLSIDHNKNITTGADEFYHTKIRLDAEGNLRAVTDPRSNIVMQYKYSMLGNMVYQKSMDSGQRWILTNIMGKPLRSWDERGHELQYFYDILQRPSYSVIKGGDGVNPLNNIFDRIFYGESLLAAGRSNEAALQAKNLLGQVLKHYDTGGLVDTPDYDFKGQPKTITRKLFSKYKETANWTDTNLNSLESGPGYTFTVETDALGRISKQTAPDKSIIIPLYNETGLLNGEKVNCFNPATNTFDGEKEYIKSIDYNEKGQREKIIYGNNVSTRFYYDRETFRMKRLESKRSNGDPLQDWYYTYDPVGNITHVEDKNIPKVFFNNQKIEGTSSYTYDALYRLVEAKGRENDNALNFGSCDNWIDLPFLHAMAPGDPMAVRNYIQSYRYDAAGNITEMKHLAAGGNWTRTYEYEPGGNRLKKTGIGDIGNPVDFTKYKHHTQHGFLEELPHLEKIAWNFKEEVVMTTRQHCTNGNIPVITYYQYDSQGKRIRKITENEAVAGALPTKKEERIYVAGYELYKKHSSPDAGLERVTLNLTDEAYRFVMIETRNDVDDGTDKQTVRYQLHNHLGSAALELDGTGEAKVISYEEYHPFGTTAYQAKNKNIKCAAKRYRYTGMERDEETGLEYHRSRYYMPWLGRWLSADPVGMDDGVNVYSYTANNPLKMTDLKGRSGEETNIVTPFVKTVLDNYGIPYAEQVQFKMIKSTGEVITGQFDLVLIDPRSGLPVALELKGIDPDAFSTVGQEEYIKAFETPDGAEIKVTGSKGGKLGLSKGTLLNIDESNFTRVFLSNQGDFSDAVAQITGGKPIKHAFFSPETGWKMFDDTTEFHSFLESKGIDPKTGGKLMKSLSSSLPSGKVLATIVGFAYILKPAAAFAGPAGDVLEVGLAAHTVSEAPPEERAQVAAEETAGFVGGAAGASVGIAAGAAGAGGIAAALGIASGPPGWLVIGLSIVGAGLFGYGGEQLGRSIAKSGQNPSVTPTKTPSYQEELDAFCANNMSSIECVGYTPPGREPLMP